MLQVQRAFATDSTLYCQYSVYGAAKDETGSLMPRVTAGYEIRRTDGVVFKRSAPTPINPTSVGALLRLNGIALRGAQPGQYELVLTVKDELAGQLGRGARAVRDRRHLSAPRLAGARRPDGRRLRVSRALSSGPLEGPRVESRVYRAGPSGPAPSRARRPPRS